MSSVISIWQAIGVPALVDVVIQPSTQPQNESIVAPSIQVISTLQGPAWLRDPKPVSHGQPNFPVIICHKAHLLSLADYLGTVWPHTNHEMTQSSLRVAIIGRTSNVPSFRAII